MIGNSQKRFSDLCQIMNFLDAWNYPGSVCFMKARNELRIVKDWVRHMLYVKHVNFHPDTPIADYVTPEGAAAFPASKKLQRQLNKFFLVCQEYGTDIYRFSLPIFRAYLKIELQLSR